jgi:hypothetical protein
MAVPEKLRAVAPDERPKRLIPLSLLEAADHGTHRDLLVAMRTRLAASIQDPKCHPRDLAALSRRLQDVAREIEEIDARDDPDAGAAADTEDDTFDAEAL